MRIRIAHLTSLLQLFCPRSPPPSFPLNHMVAGPAGELTRGDDHGAGEPCQSGAERVTATEGGGGGGDSGDAVK